MTELVRVVALAGAASNCRSFTVERLRRPKGELVDFALFILVTAILFIRPTDFVPGLEEIPLYQIAIVPCIILSWHKLIPQLTTAGCESVRSSSSGSGSCWFPIDLESGARAVPDRVRFRRRVSQRSSSFTCSCSRTSIPPARLKLFLGCLVGIILIPILLAVLNYHGLYRSFLPSASVDG